MTQEQVNKVELSDKIRKAVQEFNLLIDEANKLKIKADFIQKFHPMSNANGAPMNPHVKVIITEEIAY